MFAVIFAVVAALPTTAQACRVSGSQTPILHDHVPPETSGLIVAEVEITSDIRSVARPPLEARIISMIRGEYGGSKMRIEPQIKTSCDGEPYLGQRGIVVGRVLKIAGDALVVVPVRALSAAQTRLESMKVLKIADDALAFDSVGAISAAQPWPKSVKVRSAQ